MKVLMNRELLELFQTGRSRRYREVARNRELMAGFIRVVKTMMTVDDVDELSIFSYLHYERLRHQWSGCSSVRLSNCYIHRLIFRETSDGLQVELIDINDTPYGNKR